MQSADTPAKKLRSIVRRLRRRLIAARAALAARRRASVIRGVDRLVDSPVFVFSSVRSGSTLLRMILNSHTEVCAPHEMHLASIKVSSPRHTGKVALKTMELGTRDLENLLWDRILCLKLEASGKSIIVDKTPNNTLQWQRIAEFWPSARFLFLHRHPAQVARSLVSSRPDVAVDEHYRSVNEYAWALHESRSALGGLTVRYEDLTADPAGVTRTICEWLGVPWEEGMLDYGAQVHDGGFMRGLGDWSAKIRSGKIIAADEPPPTTGIPDALREACKLLGYAD